LDGNWLQAFDQANSVEPSVSRMPRETTPSGSRTRQLVDNFFAQSKYSVFRSMGQSARCEDAMFRRLQVCLPTPRAPTDVVAFNLVGESWHDLFSDAAGPLDFAVAVAGARSFNGKRFSSLAEYFRLSVSAMAIRLLELNLVEH
jgi:hypothetical protein